MNDSSRKRSSYEDILAMVRADAASTSMLHGEAGFQQALRLALRQERQRVIITIVVIATMLGTWVASFVWHPIANELCPWLEPHDVFDIGLVPAINLCLCIVLVMFPHAGAQMFVRACCWSYLVVCAFSTAATPGVMPLDFPVTALGCGTILLVLGAHGLEPERYRGVFVPLAHRVTLTWAMILGIADLQTLLAVNQAHRWMYPLPDACALGMVIAAFGLYRLRVWGLWLNLGMNAIVAALAVSNNLVGVSLPVAYTLAATAIAQTVLVIPLVRSILHGGTDEHPSLLRVMPWIARVIVALIMLTTIVFAWRGPDPDALQRFCSSHAEERECQFRRTQKTIFNHMKGMFDESNP